MGAVGWHSRLLKVAQGDDRVSVPVFALDRDAADHIL